MKTTEFLDKVKEKYSLSSDYKLAKFLSIGQQTISNYRHGKTFFDDAVAIHVAELLDLDPAYVLACVHAERAKRPQVKEAWQIIADGARRGAAILILGAGLFAGMPAGNSAQAGSVLDGNIHYTKRRRAASLQH